MATKKVEHAKGSGKSTKAKVIALLEREALTVPEICKRTGISVAHARTLLLSFDRLKREKSLTRYSLPASK